MDVQFLITDISSKFLTSGQTTFTVAGLMYNENEKSVDCGPMAATLISWLN